MEHYDVEQLKLNNTNTGMSYWTFCSCGIAFGGQTSDEAYDNWAEHEARA